MIDEVKVNILGCGGNKSGLWTQAADSQLLQTTYFERIYKEDVRSYMHYRGGWGFNKFVALALQSFF
jgi:hypothetical protein